MNLFLPKFCKASSKHLLELDTCTDLNCCTKVQVEHFNEKLNGNFCTAEDVSMISSCFCKHSEKCQVCLSLKSSLSSSSFEKVLMHKLVRHSGKHNFEECKFVVNNRIEGDFMRRMLRDYSDIQVVDMLLYGFPVGFEGDRSMDMNIQCGHEKNHGGARNFPVEIDKYLQKEASHGAIIGPFEKSPFVDKLVISPLNSVPKSTPSERRVILDLSFSENQEAVNDYVPKDSYLGEEMSLFFPKVDDFIALILRNGPGCLLYKLDLRRAYRQISICPGDYSLVAYSWQGHIFCDAVLPMGLRSSALICQRVTAAFAFMMYQFGFPVLNYLDDFAGAEKGDNAKLAFLLLRSLFEKSGIEEALDKACAPTEIMVFLGVLFNTITMTMEITPERLKEILLLLDTWLNKQVASIKDIQRLIGKLNFVGSCVRPGRVFINRILNWLRDCYSLGGNKFSIPEEVRRDLFWWHTFLPLYNGISLIDYGEWWQADSVFTSDACLTGCGGFCGNLYFHSEFPSFVVEQSLHISALELLTVVVSLKLWGVHLKGKKVLINCDNLASCIVINSGKSRCPFMQKCLREICFLAAVNEFQVKAQHLEGVSNRLADSLSRWHLGESFQESFREMTRNVFNLEEISIEDETFRFSHNW